MPPVCPIQGASSRASGQTVTGAPGYTSFRTGRKNGWPHNRGGKAFLHPLSKTSASSRSTVERSVTSFCAGILTDLLSGATNSISNTDQVLGQTEALKHPFLAPHWSGTCAEDAKSPRDRDSPVCEPLAQHVTACRFHHGVAPHEQ